MRGGLIRSKQVISRSPARRFLRLYSLVVQQPDGVLLLCIYNTHYYRTHLPSPRALLPHWPPPPPGTAAAATAKSAAPLHSMRSGSCRIRMGDRKEEDSPFERGGVWKQQKQSTLVVLRVYLSICAQSLWFFAVVDDFSCSSTLYRPNCSNAGSGRK